MLIKMGLFKCLIRSTGKILKRRLVDRIYVTKTFAEYIMYSGILKPRRKISLFDGGHARAAPLLVRSQRGKISSKSYR